MRGIEYLTSGIEDGSIRYVEDLEAGFGFHHGAAIETVVAGEDVKLGIKIPRNLFSTEAAQRRLADFLDMQREEMGDLALRAQ